ncbi:hypothetical protein [Nocardia sp. NPDC058666]|uniref:hypothetical protein n=1 Tax=unclassified Nocardia TaxID=2637762 RepID=UPI003655A8C2
MGANAPSVDQISAEEGLPRSTLYAALRGDRIPSEKVVATLVRAWGGDESHWLRRRSDLQDALGGRSQPRPTQSLRDGSAWLTFPITRTVLGVVTSVASLRRLLSVVALFETDFRVQTAFTINPTSALTQGLSDLLADLGIVEVPWHEAVTRRFDVVLSMNMRFCRELAGPFFAFASDVAAPPDLERFNGWIGVTDEAELLRVRAAVPASDGKIAVVGDPYFDQMIVSRYLRGNYRRSIGVNQGEKLVVVSSSWGRTSFLGQRPDLPTTLLDAFPAREFRVALVLHPNVWVAHGHRQVIAWMSDAVDRGVLLIPPSADERAVLLAADVVVGDRSSVTSYGMAMGLPTLIVNESDDRWVPVVDNTSPAYKLDLDGDIRSQFEKAITARQAKEIPTTEVGSLQRIADHARTLQSILYDLLEIEQPSAPQRFRPVEEIRVAIVPHGTGFDKEPGSNAASPLSSAAVLHN